MYFKVYFCKTKSVGDIWKMKFVCLKIYIKISVNIQSNIKMWILEMYFITYGPH